METAVMPAQNGRKGGRWSSDRKLAVLQIRKAVEKIGLLPQKSTYFYPKIATGLVFKAL